MMMLLQTAAEAVAAAVPVNDPAIAKWVEGLADQGTLAVATVWLMQALKRWPAFQWLSKYTTTRNHVTSTALAIISGVWVTFHITGDANAGWQIGIPPAHILWNTVTRIFGQKVGQDFIYRIYDHPAEVIAVASERMDHDGKPIDTKKD